MKKVFIKYLSHYHPDGIISNSKFAETLDTTESWITDNVGIVNRHFMNDYDGNSPVYEISRRSFTKLLSAHPDAKDNVDLIISCGTHDDIHYPNPGNLIAEEFNIVAPVMQLKVACTSVAYAISIAKAYIQANMARNVLILNGEPFTRFIDYGDRTSCILFGDAATSLVVSSDKGIFEVLDVKIGGKGFKIVEASRTSDTSHFTPNEFSTGHVSPNKPILNRRRNSDKKFQQDGKAVVEFVLKHMPEAVSSFLSTNELTIEDINYFISHQSNLSMMKKLIAALNLEKSCHLYNITEFGNTGSAGWISVLSQNQSSIGSAKNVLISSFGAGMTWANMILRKL